MAEYDVFEGVEVSDFRDGRVTANVCTDSVGDGRNFEVSLFCATAQYQRNSHISIFFTTKEDFKKFVENLQTVVQELDNVNRN